MRSLGTLPTDPRACGWFDALGAPADGEAQAGIDRVYAHLARRAARERALDDALGDAVLGEIAIDDALLIDDAPAPRRVVSRARDALRPLWGAP